MAERSSLRGLHLDAPQEDAAQSNSQSQTPSERADRRHSSPRRAIVPAWKMLFSWHLSPQRRVKPVETETSARPSAPARPPTKRLGRAELGFYAYEERMPAQIASLLKSKGQTTAKGIVNILDQLLRQSSTTKFAYLCHPSVQHVSKIQGVGGFCGYRNIQMMVSYMNHVGFPGSEPFERRLPSIFELQDFIECAWDLGINSQGREETGGIRGTRKYIGTPEAQALFYSLGVPCAVQAFKTPERGKSVEILFQAVESYFRDNSGASEPGKCGSVQQTMLPPIYLQLPGHSLTIVGFERQREGQSNLLIFDPVYRDVDAMVRLVGHKFQHRVPDKLLKPYRRNLGSFQKHREFEILRLSHNVNTSTVSGPSTQLLIADSLALTKSKH